ncbi:MAG: AAA family ATPase [Deltaproteobacteria bacterium]|nr:AAA family ATPase [Deltaproteobacteria bacterium]
MGILGPRQVGKSTLLREILAPVLKAQYQTLDERDVRNRALASPSHFLLAESQDLSVPLIIDEVQKAPELFDEMKALIDKRRVPGRFFLSGSTEFSQKTGIRESLTGRIGISRLYPLNLAEITRRSLGNSWLKFKPEIRTTAWEIEEFLQNGGMPGICFLRSQEERSAVIDSWLETTCFRDLQQVQGSRLEGQLARDILLTVASQDFPTASSIAAALKVDPRKVKTYLLGLEGLFVIHSVAPHAKGVGKTRYLLFDCGIAARLGASRFNRLRIWILNEFLTQSEYHGKGHVFPRYYQSKKGSHVAFVTALDGKETGIILTEESSPGTYLQRTAIAFKERVLGANAIILAPTSQESSLATKVRVLPWVGMA